MKTNPKYDCKLRIRIQITTLCIALLTTTCSIASAEKKDAKPKADDKWTENVDDALKKAKEDKKNVVIALTGSSWCPPCMALEKKVFSKSEFQEKAIEKFHLVRLVFPRSSSDASKHAQEWQKKLSISSFPTIVLVDELGRPFASTSKPSTGPDAYLKHLDELIEKRTARDEAFTKAYKAEGEERAKLLDDAISTIPEQFVSDHYEEVIKEIVSIDENDKLGLRTKYYAAQDKEARKQAIAKISMVARTLKGEKALKFIDQTLDEMSLPPMVKIEALQHKLKVLKKIKETEKATQLLDEMIALEGVSANVQNRLIVQKAYLMAGNNAGDAIELLNKFIGQKTENIELCIAKGDLLDRVMNKPEEAIVAFDEALTAAGSDSERVAEIVTLKTEALVGLKKLDDALEIFNQFIKNESHPAYLRSDSLIQKSLLLREADRTKEADESEAQALDLIEDPEQKQSLEKYIEQLKKKFAK